MKKIISILLSLITLLSVCTMSAFSFSGCSRLQQQPPSKVILSDLQAIVRDEMAYRDNFNLTVEDFEVVLSKTDNDSYNASINAIAKAEYAEFYWPVEVEYLKYDQGWKLVDHDIDSYTCKVIKYPGKARIKQMINDLNLPDTTKKGRIAYEDDCILYYVDLKAAWSKYASATSDSTIRLKYNDYDDDWRLSGAESENGVFELTEELEGKKIALISGLSNPTISMKNGYVLFENVTKSGFDISVESSYYNLSPTHVELREGNIDWTSSGGSLTLTYSKSNSFSVTIVLPQEKKSVPGIGYQYNIAVSVFDNRGRIVYSATAYD